MYNQITANKRKTILLIVLTVLLIGAVGYVFGYLNNAGPYGLVLAVILALFMSLISYFTGDKIALAISGAHEIQKNDNPYVWRMIENLCITAGLPMPRVYIIPDNAMNAFATGRNPQRSSIAVTQGLIDNLENEELEGVLAHELSHVQNYDIRVMMIVATLIGVIVLMSDAMFRMRFFGGGRRSENNQANAVLLIIGLVLMILAPIIGQLIKLAVSRRREFLADASGALLTRYPQGLANALQKIAQHDKPLARVSNATAHLFFASPFGAEGTRSFVAKLFSTHPPVEERIRALESMT